MRALSSKTELFDPYRAGFALGENLAALAPEVVFLYSSMHYATPELLEGLYDGLDSDKAIIIGNTGAGIYETSGFITQGAAALRSIPTERSTGKSIASKTPTGS